ncbi:MAG: Cof-type HAD-IIB family hydrolase [Lachnospiraceae bacterium]|nr:Cof-type HAD-IIB family hydrolase [Lachnospiraceae bacterium]
MKKDRRIVFFDIDGTIFEEGIGTPDSTREALGLLKKQGHIPVVCTGRPVSTLFPEVLDLEFSGIIGGAGTYVEYEGKVLRNLFLEHELVERTVPRMEAVDCTVVLEGPDFLSYRTDGKAPLYYQVIGRLHREYPDRVKEMEPEKDEVCKVSAQLGDPEAFDAMIPELKKEFSVVRYERFPFVEMMPAGINKADGIQALIDYLNIPRSNTYAFGDGPNDLEMLQYVQYGTAMGNSEESVLQAAEYKTEGIWEDGIYLGLKRYGLI